MQEKLKKRRKKESRYASSAERKNKSFSQLLDESNVDWKKRAHE
ncbi:DUF3886 domain-containing protein [Bacillus sp. NPDC093026]